MTQERRVVHIVLALALVMGFIFGVSLFIYYIRENYGLTCGCRDSLPIGIAVLASLGVFVGLLTYYFLSKAFYKQRKKLIGSIEKTLDFLDGEEKVIVSALIQQKGFCTQRELARQTGLSAVKLHRRLVSLEAKGLVHKVKVGMTNKLVLREDLTDLFAQ